MDDSEFRFHNPLREAARVAFLKEFSELPVELTTEQLLEFLRRWHNHANYYAWLVQYIQKACFLMGQHVDEAVHSVTHDSEDQLVFRVSNKARTQFVEFTGRVLNEKIATGINQKLELKSSKEA